MTTSLVVELTAARKRFGDVEALRGVDLAIDRVRNRYGNAALTRGVLLGRDPGWEMPMLPE